MSDNMYTYDYQNLRYNNNNKLLFLFLFVAISYTYVISNYEQSNLFTGGGYSDNNNMFLLLFVIVGYVLYKLWTNYNVLLNKVDSQTQAEIQSIQNNNNNDDKKRILINVTQPPMLNNPFREYDYRTLRDPLVAPRRRDDYNLPVLPVPTRGFPAPYKKMGLLIDNTTNNNDKYKILLLMGRSKFPSSNVYDYYAMENLPDSAIKFNIDTTKELQTDDTVKISEINKTYRVTLDKTLGYEYDPYMY